MSSEMKQTPLLPLRGLIVFPSMVLHLDVGRDKSIAALEKAMMDDQQILLAAQKKVSIDEPEPKDIYNVGTLAKVKQTLKLPNGTLRVLVEGLYRAEIQRYTEEEETFVVETKKIEEVYGNQMEEEALMRTLLDQFEQYVNASKKVTKETFSTVADIEESARLADMVTSHLTLKVKDKQELLEMYEVSKRLEHLIELISNE